jgi:hemolysin activation/secretion protein
MSRSHRANRQAWNPETKSRTVWAITAVSMLLCPLAARSNEAAAQPSAGSPPAASAPARPAAAPAAAQPFDVLEYRIEGNTLLSRVDVERAVTPFLGPRKTIKDIEAARAALERVYHDHGYRTVLVNIPPQRVADGVVRLHVLEAPVGKLRILGSRYHSLTVIRGKMAQLAPGSVPDFQVVQRELGDVNRSPDLKVTPVLRASDTPGQVDVDLQVEDTLPLHYLLEVDNRYSANTAHARETGELHYDNLFQSGQSLSVQYQIAAADPQNSEILSVSYVIPTTSGPVWALYFIHSDSNVAAVGAIDVIGKGEIYGLRWIDPLPTSSRDFFHSFTAGIDYKDFGQNVTTQGSGSTIQSPVSYLPFTLDYTATWLGAAPAQSQVRAATNYGRSSTSLDLDLNFLTSALGGDWQEFANRRANASGSYIILHPSLTREQVLPGRWSLVGRVSGQLASGPLINNEQFAIGGAESVRGYTEAERLGDDGINGSLEVRTPQLARSARIEQSYLSLFVDAGRVRTLEPLPGQTPTFSLASSGVGLRFKAGPLYLALDGARILTDGAVTEAGRYRGSFRVVYSR